MTHALRGGGGGGGGGAQKQRGEESKSRRVENLETSPTLLLD